MEPSGGGCLGGGPQVIGSAPMEHSAALAFLWVPALRCYRETQPMGTLSQTLHVTFKLSVSF